MNERAETSKFHWSEYAKFREWFATTKWFDDPVYCEIADAAWQAALSPAGTGQPEPTHGAMCWNGNLQSNGTVYDDATLIQIMRGEALKYRAEFQLLQEAGVRMPSQQAVMERIKLISDLERGDSVKGEGETAND